LSRPKRVLTYLHSPEWVQWIARQGYEVDLFLIMTSATWPWGAAEMPAGVRFVKEIAPTRYTCSLLPTPQEAEKHSGFYQELVTRFAELERVARLPLAFVKFLSDEMDEAVLREMVGEGRLRLLPRDTGLPDMTDWPTPVGKVVRFKRRWPVASHRAWILHAGIFAETFLGADEREPEGTYLELDAGDGAMVAYLRDRFGKLSCRGLCVHDEERQAGRRVLADLPLEVKPAGLSWTQAVRPESADYMGVADADVEQVSDLASAIRRGCRRGAVMSIQKLHEGPSTNWLKNVLAGWRLLETATHYFALYEPKGSSCVR
jgi:hypothetical protein